MKQALSSSYYFVEPDSYFSKLNRLDETISDNLHSCNFFIDEFDPNYEDQENGNTRGSAKSY